MDNITYKQTSEGSYIGWLTNNPSVMSIGDSLEELKENIQKAEKTLEEYYKLKRIIVFEYDFGQEKWGKIESIDDGLYFQCYETSVFGGTYYKVGIPFDDFEKAKKFLLSLT